MCLLTILLEACYPIGLLSVFTCHEHVDLFHKWVRTQSDVISIMKRWDIIIIIVQICLNSSWKLQLQPVDFKLESAFCHKSGWCQALRLPSEEWRTPDFSAFILWIRREEICLRQKSIWVLLYFQVQDSHWSQLDCSHVSSMSVHNTWWIRGLEQNMFSGFCSSFNVFFFCAAFYFAYRSTLNGWLQF